MIVHSLEALTLGCHYIAEIPSLVASWHIQIPLEGSLLAQNVTDPDVIGQMQRAFKNFIESGQVWALIIGLVVGYGFRSLLP
ncbi:hypothetical protein [Lusitaniella coriacea]|uniref:hypothetical protein n=1 Tax=Lusitaniella coriacea TaxID=1983105 RepID=UPI003CF49D65